MRSVLPLLVLLLAGCPSVGSPRPPPPMVDSCDDPHPVDAQGRLVHDYMTDGTGRRRCWYCDELEPLPTIPK